MLSSLVVSEKVVPLLQLYEAYPNHETEGVVVVNIILIESMA